jgi:fatty-acyl-CoA synthase
VSLDPVVTTMMHAPLTVRGLYEHGARLHRRSRLVDFDGETLVPTPFPEVADRAARLATALGDLGVRRGDVVATLCWNHRAHMEAYLAVPSMGAVLHTLNLRLFPDQLAWIMEHAPDAALIVDADLLPLLGEVLDGGRVPGLGPILVVGGDGTPVAGRSTLAYEATVDAAAPLEAWPEVDETDPAAICYTSGTTGNPKGVVYGQRSVFVHSLASMARDTFGIGQDDRVLMMPPMFHANAWGLPYSAWLAGADLIMPASHLKPPEVRRIIEAERPTFTAMVPTLVNDLLAAHERDPLDAGCFRVIVSGGSPVAPALIRRVRETWGVPILQGWGMTETSPLCALSIPPRGTPVDEEPAWRATAGRPVPGMRVRLRDDAGEPVPEDGTSVGELQLRGHWVTGGYHRDPAPESFTADGWLRTGDVGAIDADGYVRITDRVKDVIKSGGEWISSVDLENRLLEHPAVAEAAVLGVPDPRWEERPLALIVPTDGGETDFAALREHLTGQVARFWLPEYWAAVDALPRTGVGKVDKKRLREAVAEREIEIRTVR